jgi:hypothetical protein
MDFAMARDHRGRKALYEVMSKARLKPGIGGAFKQKHPKMPDEKKPPVQEKPAAERPDVATQWWKKPRIVQFNAGRIEFSMPYQLAIALLLGLILMALITFRLGQHSRLTKQQTIRPAEEMQVQKIVQESPPKQATVDTIQKPAVAEDISPRSKEVGPAEPISNNVIVLVEYKARADLEPVQKHFAQYGIETEIIMEGGRYLLVTKGRYDNPEKAGTDGYKVKQRIIEVGALYKGKAPAGYETFAPNFFKDAYGKKIK